MGSGATKYCFAKGAGPNPTSLVELLPMSRRPSSPITP